MLIPFIISIPLRDQASPAEQSHDEKEQCSASTQAWPLPGKDPRTQEQRNRYSFVYLLKLLSVKKATNMSSKTRGYKGNKEACGEQESDLEQPKGIWCLQRPRTGTATM